MKLNDVSLHRNALRALQIYFFSSACTMDFANEITNTGFLVNSYFNSGCTNGSILQRIILFFNFLKNLVCNLVLVAQE